MTRRKAAMAAAAMPPSVPPTIAPVSFDPPELPPWNSTSWGDWPARVTQPMIIYREEKLINAMIECRPHNLSSSSQRMMVIGATARQDTSSTCLQSFSAIPICRLI